MDEIRVNVSVRDIKAFTNWMTKAGFTVVDTGIRIMTEEGMDGEATLVLTRISIVDVNDADVSHGVKA